MEFGDNEWFEKVEEIYNFPIMLGFYLSNKSKSINNLEIDTKAYKVSDIKYHKIAPRFKLANGEKLALLEVERIYSSQGYYETICKLKEDWA